jgi:hypothetical protein
MKLIIYLAVWKRPEITEICFMGIDRIRKRGVHDIEAFAVISEEEMKPLCDKYEIEYCFYKNHPLGEKKNYGVSQLIKKDFDYMVEIGSDDILKNEFFDVYGWDLPVMSLKDFLVINTKDLRCRHLSRYRGGTGRAIRKDALEKVGKLWHDGKIKGLDGNSTINLARVGLMERVYSTEPVTIDLKSSVNISPFRGSIGYQYDFDKAVDGLSAEEIEAIKALSNVEVES